MRLTGAKLGASRLTRIVSKVEVERKFTPGPNFTSAFMSEDSSPFLTRRYKIYNSNINNQRDPFFIVVQKPVELIRDIYYDTNDHRLSTLGLWVRQRKLESFLLHSSGQQDGPDGDTVAKAGVVPAQSASQRFQWNAKLRLGGHFNNSEFVEIDGKQNVSDEVLRITEADTRLEDLQVVTDLHSRRLSWEVTQLADGTKPAAQMTIVMDMVTEAEPMILDNVFNHLIGEVELFQEFQTEDVDKGAHEAQRKKISALRMEELKGFMMANTNLFATTPKPIGKLTAYEMWKNSRG